MSERLLTHENPNRIPVIYMFVVPVIVFLYFLQWKTHVFYGDDLLTYKYYTGLKTFSEKVNMAAAAEKYRPIHGISLQLIIDSFDKNADGYYWFNVIVQSINIFIFACLLNLYLATPVLSMLFGLLVGLSRFAFFNITQLTSGGALEGLALTFFLGFLYYVVKQFKSSRDKTLGPGNMLFAILFANLSLYTHERYIVLLPFLLLVLIATTTLKKVKQKHSGLIAALIIGSIFLNVFVKKYVFGMPFFVGTAGTHVDFSFSTAFSFLKEAVLNIFLVNTGPEYLVGTSFSSLSLFYKLITVLTLLFIFFLLVRFFRKELVHQAQQEKLISPRIIDFLLLGILFFLLLAPAIVTIRLEHRWLQASYSVLVLTIAMLLGSFRFNNSMGKYILCAGVACVFLLVDRQYLSRGANLTYMMACETSATIFKKSVDKGLIRNSTENLYVWEKTRNENAENEAKWYLGDGYFFDFYGGNKKNLVFIDSVYQRFHSTADTVFFHFNPKTDQFIYATNEVFEITQNFLRDSLKNFDQQGTAGPLPPAIQYDSTNIKVGPGTFSDFILTGFYDNEGGFRWTNGNASIGFKKDFIAKDSFSLKLNTYMPPVCKDVSPRISIVAGDSTKYDPFYSNRKGDIFVYKFYFKQPKSIQRINIIADTIKTASRDTRRLSFPFISLELYK